MVRDSEFREDLYYRLNVLPIEMPPLRERSEDIPLLCQHFIDKLNTSLESAVKGIAPAAMAILLQHQWAGNVRELENAIERAMVLTEGDILLAESFSFSQARKAPVASVEELFDSCSLKNAQKIVEKKLITKALKVTQGNRTHAAKLLEISHPSLLSKMKLYKIDL